MGTPAGLAVSGVLPVCAELESAAVVLPVWVPTRSAGCTQKPLTSPRAELQAALWVVDGSAGQVANAADGEHICALARCLAETPSSPARCVAKLVRAVSGGAGTQPLRALGPAPWGRFGAALWPVEPGAWVPPWARARWHASAAPRGAFGVLLKAVGRRETRTTWPKSETR